MADTAFQFTWLPRDEGSKAARKAVYHQLVGGAVEKLPNDGVEQIQLAADELLKQWRARLHVLKLSGLEPLLTGKSVQYARNCWPTMFGQPKGSKGTRPCGMVDLCPWCWARRVDAVYNAITTAMPWIEDDPAYQADKEPPWRLVSYLGRKSYALPCKRQLRDILIDHIGSLREFAQYNRSHLFGHYLWLTVSPGFDVEKVDESFIGKDVESWTVHTRFVSVVRGLDELQFAPDWWTKKDFDSKNRPAWPTPLNIFNHVVSTCTYPLAMMRADRDRTVECLRARTGLRLAEFSKRFRVKDKPVRAGRKEIADHE